LKVEGRRGVSLIEDMTNPGLVRMTGILGNQRRETHPLIDRNAGT
jgi:hypothetical protein